MQARRAAEKRWKTSWLNLARFSERQRREERSKNATYTINCCCNRRKMCVLCSRERKETWWSKRVARPTKYLSAEFRCGKNYARIFLFSLLVSSLGASTDALTGSFFLLFHTILSVSFAFFRLKHVFRCNLPIVEFLVQVLHTRGLSDHFYIIIFYRVIRNRK